MRYAYHFEFCERPELPEWLRGDVFRSLAFIEGGFGMTTVLSREVPKLVRALAPTRVIEIGSGSGDGLALVARGAANETSPPLECLATDRFPQPELWKEKLSGVPGVRWSDAAVGFDDFDRVLGASALKGSVVLLVNAFHHLPPEQARGFVARAAAAGAHVVVVEPLSRSVVGILMGLGAGLIAPLVPLLTLLGGRPGPSWLRAALFHWLVPLVPVILSHDGVVSALRQRTTEEWRALSAGLPLELTSVEGLGPFSNFSARVLTNKG